MMKDKVVIPDHVDSFIKSKKKNCALKVLVSSAISNANNLTVPLKAEVWISDNLGKFVDAYRYGYTVEEKKYYVVLDAKHALCKFAEGVFGVYEEDTDKLMFDEDFKLTEKEIKDFDSRFWAFAEKVTE